MKFESLKRELALFDVFAIASGAMISSGIFILPGLAHARAGPAVVFSYLIAGLLAATAMLSQAELASAMPRAGGAYFFIARTLGSGAATISGLLEWFSLMLKVSFALMGMAVFAHFLVDIDISYIAMFLTIAFVVLNIAGVRASAQFQKILIIILIAILIAYIISGTRFVYLDKLSPFMPHGIGRVFATAGFVFISYGGILKVASLAEEVKNPGRNIPLGMILSLFSVTILYTAVVLVTTGMMDSPSLDKSLTPLYDGGVLIFGKIGGLVMAVAALLAFATTANAGIMAAARYPLAMSRDMLLPSFFQKTHKRAGTPYVSIIITGIAIILSLLISLEFLVEAASIVLIMTFICGNLGVIIMRESRIQNYQPQFRAPLYPWMQIVGIVGLVLLIFEMGIVEVLMVLAMIVAGFLFYWFYGRIRAMHDCALARILERFGLKELACGLLERELCEIIKERDGIVADKLDEIIETAPVLDISKSVTMEEFFRLAAKELSPVIGEDYEKIFLTLLHREKDSSTVLRTGLAIPHIIIEGENKFYILIVRCKDGIVFPDAEDKVHAAFVMVGSADTRNFYLRALAAVIEIVNSHQFDRKWLSARNSQELRDIMILGRKRRF